jgi:hypothetical protein
VKFLRVSTWRPEGEDFARLPVLDVFASRDGALRRIL